MTFIKWCGCAVICAAAALMLRSKQSETAAAVTVLCGVFFIGAAVVSLSPVFGYITELSSQEFSGTPAYFSVLAKSLALGIAASVTAEICRDCGEASTAKKVEMLACAEIILLCLPLVKSLLECAQSLLG